MIAQFRPGKADGRSARWWLDFATQLSPHESRTYRIEYGEGVEKGPERTTGHQLSERGDTFVIENAPYITWVVPKHLKGFLRSVNFPPSEHLRAESRGLFVTDSAGRQHLLGGDSTKSTVIRQGRMAVALRFEKTESKPELKGVRWTADLVFPTNVSWVEATLTVNDPRHRVAEVGMQLRQNLDKPTGRTPTLVDMGAAGTVYTRLVGEQQIELVATPAVREVRSKNNAATVLPWRIFKGTPGQMRPFVFAAKAGARRADGWIHVMDKQRCLALSVFRFAGRRKGRIAATADGTVTVTSGSPEDTQGAAGDRHSLRAWLHFVFFPPQQSATASPQAMQHPIETSVRVKR